MKRAPRPRLPLFTGQTLSLDDYLAAEEAARPERADQRALIAELRNPLATCGPVLTFHVPNGFFLPGLSRDVSARVWRTLQADGALPGASDLLIGHEGRVLLLEMKRAKGGLASPAQDEFRGQALAAGLDYRVANGLREARNLLIEMGVLRP
jgi:hypothetical protein